MTGLSDIFNAPFLLTLVLWVVAAASSVTVVQRVLLVRRQALADPALPS
jgi:CDP-diacylglycerol--glycerol-3-phosphate 3-phosphatidyltransferase/CDP-diacylglycerol--inositol 3-phosphatidyltransferase